MALYPSAGIKGAHLQRFEFLMHSVHLWPGTFCVDQAGTGALILLPPCAHLSTRIVGLKHHTWLVLNFLFYVTGFTFLFKSVLCSPCLELLPGQGRCSTPPGPYELLWGSLCDS